MTLRKLLQRQQPLLDELFGKGAYSVDADVPHQARIIADWLELSLVYDWRDQFISSSITPLNVPPEQSEPHTIDTLLRFCGVTVGVRRKSALDEQQVTDELARIAPLIQLLKDDRKSRDATWFVRGYNDAYTAWASGEWD